MNCTNCGREVPDIAIVCGYCGHVLKAVGHPVAVAPLPAEASPALQRKSGSGWIWVVVAGLGAITVAAILFIVFWKPSTPVLPDSPAVPAPQTMSTTCEDKLAFVSDVTIPDGTAFGPGEPFTKTWRIKNTGACTWTTNYRLAFRDGQQMGASQTNPLTESVSPGQEVDISIALSAPSTPGPYKSFWRLQNADGIVVPVDGVADNSIFVDITVRDTNILLYDDFTEESGGWPVFGDQKGEVGYQSGNFRIAFYQPMGFHAVWSLEEYTDFIVETVFSVPANISDVGAGFTLRANEKRWYLLWIYPFQGKYLFQKDINEQVTELIPLTKSNVIRPIEKTGRYYIKLKIEARGDKFDIWVAQPESDYEYLDSVSDSDLSRGHLGPSADCPDKPFTSPVEVLFEWIKISE